VIESFTIQAVEGTELGQLHFDRNTNGRLELWGDSPEHSRLAAAWREIATRPEALFRFCEQRTDSGQKRTVLRGSRVKKGSRAFGWATAMSLAEQYGFRVEPTRS
jgi:hypothetical protein